MTDIKVLNNTSAKVAPQDENYLPKKSPPQSPVDKSLIGEVDIEEKIRQGDVPTNIQSSNMNLQNLDNAKVKNKEPQGSNSSSTNSEDGSLKSPNKSKTFPGQLTFHNISYSVQIQNEDATDKNNKFINKDILKNISGICYPGQLTAIIGASGAGKTSLLNILACRVSKNTKGVTLDGTLNINGEAYDAQKMSKFAAYVMQNDYLLESQTPRELITFAAKMKMEGTPEQRERKVEELLRDLKLERVADSFIGGLFKKSLSGGEKKRVSIAMQLVNNPNVLFLDEPTSGLDSFTSFLLIKHLKEIANKGKAIIFTIHQPSSDIFNLFDRLMILAKGSLTYQGPTKSSVNYFSSINYECPSYSTPSDYFMDLVHAGNVNHHKIIPDLVEKYNLKLKPEIESKTAQPAKTPIEFHKNPLTWAQGTLTVVRRGWKNSARNPFLLGARVVQGIFLIFLCSSLYWKIDEETNPGDIPFRNASLFFASMCGWFPSIFIMLITFPNDKTIYLSEIATNTYSASQYFIGTILVDLPTVIIIPFIQGLTTYHLIGYNDADGGKIIIYSLVYVLSSISGNSFGTLIGCLSKDNAMAIEMSPALYVPVMVFGGIMINLRSIWDGVAWVQYLSPFRFAVEALMHNEYNNSDIGTGPLEFSGMTVGMWWSIVLLFIQDLFYMGLAFLIFKRTIRVTKLQ